MKILVTGATGFLGSHLTSALLRARHSVIALRRESSDLSRLPRDTERLGFFDAGEVGEIFRNHPDIKLVIHTATNYGNRGEPLSEVLTANVILPLTLLEAGFAHGGCAFINTDTFFCKAGEEFSYLSAYTRSKKLFYELGTGFAHRNACSFVNLRIEHMFGPGDGAEKFVPAIVRRLLDGEPEIELTPGGQVRDFVYVDDVVAAYMAVIAAPELLGGRQVTCFEVGRGATHSIKDFVIAAHRLVGSSSALRFGALPYRENEIMYSKANIEALLALGWQASIDLEDGIIRVIQSIRDGERHGINTPPTSERVIQ